MLTFNDGLVNLNIFSAILFILFSILIGMILVSYLCHKVISKKDNYILKLKDTYEMAYTELKKLRLLIAIQELGSGELSIKDLPGVFDKISHNLPSEDINLISKISHIAMNHVNDPEKYLHEVSNLLSNVTNIGIKIKVKES